VRIGKASGAGDFSHGFAAAGAVTALLSFAGAIAALWPPRAAPSA
jgi:hypothetical protein